jgi:hypothetical protein
VKVPAVEVTAVAPVTPAEALIEPVTLREPVMESPALLTATYPKGLEVICFQLPEPRLRKVRISPAAVV